MLSAVTHRSVVSVAALCLFAGCSSDQELSTTTATVEFEPSREGGNLVIDALNDFEFGGSFESELGLVKFSAYRESETKLTAQALINDTLIDIYATSEDTGHVGFWVHGGKLDENAHQLLAAVHLQLADLFPYPQEGAKLDETPQHVGLLRNYLGFLSEAPMRLPDEFYDTRIGAEDRIRIGEPTTPPKPTTPPPAPPCGEVGDNDGVTLLPQCCNGGTTIAYQHDDLPGGHCFMTLGDVCGTSSPVGCAGRCGPGCTALPPYFQDCMDHDLCLVHDGGGGGLTPSGKCGDEWWDAADDFAVDAAYWGRLLTNPFNWAEAVIARASCS